MQRPYCACNVPTVHATSLQGFGYGDVVHQFKKRCNYKYQGPCLK